jgi:hypothetical protein
MKITAYFRNCFVNLSNIRRLAPSPNLYVKPRMTVEVGADRLSRNVGTSTNNLLCITSRKNKCLRYGMQAQTDSFGTSTGFYLFFKSETLQGETN